MSDKTQKVKRPWETKFEAAMREEGERNAEVHKAMEGIAIVDPELQEGAVKALCDAANWVLHVESGVGKSGGPPEVGECEDALNSLKTALERLEISARGES